MAQGGSHPRKLGGMKASPLSSPPNASRCSPQGPGGSAPQTLVASGLHFRASARVSLAGRVRPLSLCCYREYKRCPQTCRNTWGRKTDAWAIVAWHLTAASWSSQRQALSERAHECGQCAHVGTLPWQWHSPHTVSGFSRAGRGGMALTFRVSPAPTCPTYY